MKKQEDRLMKERQVRNEEPSDLPSQICNIHKRGLEFLCLNQNCDQFRQAGCPKCLLPKQIHEHCELEAYKGHNPDELNRRYFISQFQKKFEAFEKEIQTTLKRTKDKILRSIQFGDNTGLDFAESILESIDDFKSNDSTDASDKANSISDIFTYLYDFSSLQKSRTNKQPSSIISREEDQAEESKRSQHSEQTMNTSSYSSSNTHNQSSASIITSASYKLESLGFSSSFSENESFSSSKSKTSFILQSEQPKVSTNLSVSMQVSNNNMVGDINSVKLSSIINLKGKKQTKFSIQSDYIEQFCLFQTGIQPNSAQSSPKKSYLITRCEKQAISIVDLELKQEIHRISFTHNNEIIFFQQLNETFFVIFSPNSNFIWIQNIFENTNFSQVDFKFTIDSITCDPSHGGLVFLSHQQGKVSVWSLEKTDSIIKSFNAGKSTINLMDYSKGNLLVCGMNGSVKLFNFYFFQNDISLSLNRVISENNSYQEIDSLDEILVHAKIVSPDTFLLQNAGGFLEVYKNGQFCKSGQFQDSKHEQFELMNDMRIYENKYCFFKSNEKENEACIYDLSQLNLIKQFQTHRGAGIIGAYFINDSNLIVIIEDGSIQYFN